MADRWDRVAIELVQQIAADLTSADATVGVLRRRYPDDESIARLALTVDRLARNCRALIGELRG